MGWPNMGLPVNDIEGFVSESESRVLARGRILLLIE